MTPAIHTLLPAERALVMNRLEAIVDAQLEAMVRSYEARWCGLGPLARDWLREVLDIVLSDVRRDVLTLVRELVTPSRVH